MSDVVLLEPIASDPELDERIMNLRATGMSLPRIARHLMIPQHELHKRIDALLPKVDAYRRRAIAESLVTIDTIIGTHMKTIADPESASVVVRSVCERRALLGITGSTAPVMLSQQLRPEEHRSTDALDRSLKRILAMRQQAEKSSDSAFGAVVGLSENEACRRSD
jgi:hypothetical protein